MELLVTGLEVRGDPRLWTETRTAHLYRNWGQRVAAFTQRENRVQVLTGYRPQGKEETVVSRPAPSESPGSL